MKQSYYIFVFVGLSLMSVSQSALAQGLAINATGTRADTSAMLDIASTEKGILIPRMTTAQRNAIVLPATGLMVYQTDGMVGFYYYNGATWQPVAGSGGGGVGWAASGDHIYNTNTGNVGIGIATPLARLHVADSSVVFTGESNPYSITPGNPPISGAGSRMMWYADKAAFRAGIVSDDQWNKDSVGISSVALGYNAMATGEGAVALGYSYAHGGGSTALGFSSALGTQSVAGGESSIAAEAASTAFGNRAEALGKYSVALGGGMGGAHATAQGSIAIGQNTYATYYGAVALGNNATASGENSFAIGGYMGATASGRSSIAIGANANASDVNDVAIGDGAHASGGNSFAFGQNATASGIGSYAIGNQSYLGGISAGGSYSTAIGTGAYAGSDFSTAIGVMVNASGAYSFSIGYNNQASGDNSTALGNNVNTNSQNGSFAIGDNSSGSTSNDTVNQMVMRFAGGYKLFTDNGVTSGTPLGVRIQSDGVAKYLSNVSTSFDDRSLVDKHYVDSLALDTDTSWVSAGGNIHNTNTGNVGIGTATPVAKLHVADSSVVFTGIGDPTYITPGNPPVSGAGSRMMWYSDKAAFRAGYVDGDQWDKDSIGNFSVAMGQFSKATGINSVGLNGGMARGELSFAANRGVGTGINSIAFGDGCIAGGDNSFAIGKQSIASVEGAVALGYQSTASGYNSFATGTGGYARGIISTAMGYATNSDGYAAFASGMYTTAQGDHSTAMGYYTYAQGENATALGNQTWAIGDNSFATGANSRANGSGSTALNGATADGINSFAVGSGAVANGDLSMALGSSVSTNYHNGSFAIGDIAPYTTANDADNQMMMRFAGGYKLFSDTYASVGVSLDAGASSWNTISDRRKKENFAPVNGEDFLKKLHNFSLTSWNYKGQDAKRYRHYGPMAQDFYAAFGKDSYGTVGNDTTIAQADMDGVSFIAIQALEIRTAELQKKVAELEKNNKVLVAENTQLKASLTEDNKLIKSELDELKAQLQSGKLSNK